MHSAIPQAVRNDGTYDSNESAPISATAAISVIAATRAADASPLWPTAMPPGGDWQQLQASDEDRPFAVEHLRIEETQAEFTPAARLAITAALRTSGLLAVLDDAHARTLLALLSCLSPNGEARAAAFQVAEVLGTYERDARSRLERLAAAIWRGGPVVLRSEHGTLLPSYAVAPGLLSDEHPQPEPEVTVLPIPAAGREAVVQASRTAYAVPRAEAEAAVAEQLGIPEFADSDSPEGEAWRGLMAAGVPKVQARELVDEYPAEEILRQLEWLPARNAREPARFIVAAIRERYGQPPSLMLASRQIGYEPAQGPVGSTEAADD
jgi:hypothetical protein